MRPKYILNFSIANNTFFFLNSCLSKKLLYFCKELSHTSERISICTGGYKSGYNRKRSTVKDWKTVET